jgi:uncharacterized membrane protein
VRRVLIVYLVAYYLVVAGAVLTLWRSGLMTELPRGWTYSTIAIAAALGVLLWVTSSYGRGEPPA